MWTTIPIAIGVISAVAVAGRLVVRIHRLVSRFEDALPTLERIAKTYPGKKLQRNLADLEHAVDMQSQELRRLAELIEKRKEWRPQGWHQAESGG